MSLPLSFSANREDARCEVNPRVTRVPGYAALRKLLASSCCRCESGSYAYFASRGTASAIASRLMSQIKPANSLATATAAILTFLPRNICRRCWTTAHKRPLRREATIPSILLKHDIGILLLHLNVE